MVLKREVIKEGGPRTVPESDRLIKLLNILSSDNDNEVLAAVKQINLFLNNRNLIWSDVIEVTGIKPWLRVSNSQYRRIINSYLRSVPLVERNRVIDRIIEIELRWTNFGYLRDIDKKFLYELMTGKTCT